MKRWMAILAVMAGCQSTTMTTAPENAGGCAAPATASADLAKVLAIHNAARRDNGLPALTVNPRLTAAARAHACGHARIEGRPTHFGPAGETLLTRVRAVGYDLAWAGENLAWTYTDPVRVAEGLLASPVHRANILNPKAREVGQFVALGDVGTEWVLIYGRER